MGRGDAAPSIHDFIQFIPRTTNGSFPVFLPDAPALDGHEKNLHLRDRLGPHSLGSAAPGRDARFMPI